MIGKQLRPAIKRGATTNFAVQFSCVVCRHGNAERLLSRTIEQFLPSDPLFGYSYIRTPTHRLFLPSFLPLFPWF